MVISSFIYFVILFFGGFAIGGLAVGILLFKKYSTLLQIEKINFAKLQSQNDTLTNEALNQKKLLESEHQYIEKELGQRFEILAHRLFDEKSKLMKEQNQEGLLAVLNPIRDRLKEFEMKIDQTYSIDRSERSMLRGEINKLLELNQLMSKEASNLTRALKGENKTQGNWGELILENILERSGLRKGEEFVTQGTEMSLKNTNGEMIKPDIIIRLPEGKHLIVDSKMTLQAYEQYSSENDEDLRNRFAKNHVDSLKRHIDELAAKEYHLAEKLVTPDFVMLFMPIEPAFALAFRFKPDLFQYAWDKNIAIVSPTTLLSTLRTVASLWKQDRQEKNALEIAKRGGLLHDKFVGLLKDLENMGDKLSAAQKAQNDMLNKLSTGRGNLMDQVDELKRLGAKTDKRLEIN